MSKVTSLLEPALIICKLSPDEGLNHMNKTHGIKLPYSGKRTYVPRFSVRCGSALAVVEYLDG